MHVNFVNVKQVQSSFSGKIKIRRGEIMIPIDLHPNLASIHTLVSFHCLTLYLNNQTAHNWLFVALIKHGGGAADGGGFLFVRCN